MSSGSTCVHQESNWLTYTSIGAHESKYFHFLKPSNMHTNTFHASNPAIRPYMTPKSICSRFWGVGDLAVFFLWVNKDVNERSSPNACEPTACWSWTDSQQRLQARAARPKPPWISIEATAYQVCTHTDRNTNTSRNHKYIIILTAYSLVTILIGTWVLGVANWYLNLYWHIRCGARENSLPCRHRSWVTSRENS